MKSLAQQELPRSGRRARACGIGVEAQDHLGRKAAKQLRLRQAQRGPARGHDCRHARLKRLCEIEVALHEHRESLPADGRLGEVQAVERPALGVDGRLRRVQVLRQLIRLDSAAAEGDDRAALTVDRHH